MTMEFLIVALFAVSLLTNLTVEGIKKLLDKKSVDYSSNVMAAVTSHYLRGTVRWVSDLHRNDA